MRSVDGRATYPDQLEAPINSRKGETRADALLYGLSPNLILLCECKGGKNIDGEQAEKHLSVDLGWLKRTGVIPPQLKKAQNLDDFDERHSAGLPPARLPVARTRRL